MKWASEDGSSVHYLSVRIDLSVFHGGRSRLTSPSSSVSPSSVWFRRFHVTHRVHLWDLARILNRLDRLDARGRSRLSLSPGTSSCLIVPVEGCPITLLTVSGILPKDQDGSQMGCIRSRYETQGTTSDHYDTVLAHPLGYRQRVVRGTLPPLINTSDSEANNVVCRERQVLAVHACQSVRPPLPDLLPALRLH